MPNLQRKLLTKEQSVECLKTIIKNIEDDTFEGCLSFSNIKNNQSFIIAVKGVAEDRVTVIDSVFISIYSEPTEDNRNFMLMETYKRWKHYFGQTYRMELLENKV
jgi:hypothetical protein